MEPEILAQAVSWDLGPDIARGLWALSFVQAGRCGPQGPIPDLGSLSPTGGLCVVAVISFDVYLGTMKRSRAWDSRFTGGALRHGMGMTCQGYLMRKRQCSMAVEAS